MTKTTTTRRRNTFSKMAGSTYKCDVCGRNTRNTGAQSLGSKTCPQCWELAGFENSISDGHQTQAELQPTIDALLAEITSKGGAVGQWAIFLQPESNDTPTTTAPVHTTTAPDCGLGCGSQQQHVERTTAAAPQRYAIRSYRRVVGESFKIVDTFNGGKVKASGFDRESDAITHCDALNQSHRKEDDAIASAANMKAISEVAALVNVVSARLNGAGPSDCADWDVIEQQLRDAMRIARDRRDDLWKS